MVQGYLSEFLALGKARASKSLHVATVSYISELYRSVHVYFSMGRETIDVSSMMKLSPEVIKI